MPPDPPTWQGPLYEREQRQWKSKKPVNQKPFTKWIQFAPRMYGRHKEHPTVYVEVSEVHFYI